MRPGPVDLQIELFVAGERSRSDEVRVKWESDVMMLEEEKGLDSSEDDSESDLE